jgi:predicted dehydrogenase
VSRAAPRVGFVGLGNIAHHHATQLETRDATLAGGMDVDAAARERFGDEFDAPVHADVEALFGDLDAVVVTTPNRHHEEYVVAALERGLDVLVEKPLAHTLASAERIAAAAADATGFCMVGFNNRFSDAAAVLTEYQRAGRLGEVYHVEANYVRQRGIPGRGSWFTSKAVAGGGALVDLGVHAVDLALHFLGFPEVVEVTGETRAAFGGRDDYAFVEMWGEDGGPVGFDVEDSASAFLRCGDGRTVSLEVAWAANRPTTDEFFVRGTDAGARLDRASQDLTLYEAGTAGANHIVESDVETRDRTTHAVEQGVFLDAVRAGTHPGTCTVAEGLAVQRVLDAVYRSAEAGRAVEPEPAAPVAGGD